MSAVPEAVPIEIPQGSDCVVEVPDIRVAGVLVTNFAGWTARAQIRAAKRSPIILHDWAPEDIAFDGVGSSIRLRVTAAQSSAWTFWHGYYDVEAINPDGVVSRAAQGPVSVSPETTRVGV